MDHVGRDGVGAAGRGDEDVGFSGDRGQVGRVGVTERDGGVGALPFLGEHRGERHADQPAASHDDDVFAGRVGAAADEELLNAVRRGGQVAFAAQQDASLVDRVEAVDVLEGVDAVDQEVGIDALGQRQLEDDSVYIGIGVEQVDAVADSTLGLPGIEADFDSVDDDLDPGFLTGLVFAAYVAGRGEVVADEDDGEMRRESADDHVLDLPRQRLADAGSDGGAVNDRGRHAVRVWQRPKMKCDVVAEADW